MAAALVCLCSGVLSEPQAPPRTHTSSWASISSVRMSHGSAREHLPVLWKLSQLCITSHLSQGAGSPQPVASEG